MALRKSVFLLIFVMIGVTVLIGACKKGDAGRSSSMIHGPGSEANTGDAGIVPVLKNGKLANYQSTTIGKAFDSYAYVAKKEWKSEALKGQQFIIDFIGLLDPETLNDNDRKDGVTSRWIDVTFLINADGSYYVFMVSRIESKADGKTYRYQVGDIAGILDKIYANKKIVF